MQMRADGAADFQPTDFTRMGNINNNNNIRNPSNWCMI